VVRGIGLLTVGAKNLRGALQRVLLSVAHDDARPVLASVLLDVVKGQPVLVSTDSYRMHVVDLVGAEMHEDVPPDLMFGWRELKDIVAGLAGRDEPFQVQLDSKVGARLVSPEVAWALPVTAGSYVGWKGLYFPLLEEPRSGRIVADPEELVNLMVHARKTGAGMFRFDAWSREVTGSYLTDEKHGKREVWRPVASARWYPDEDKEAWVAANPLYLRDAVKATGTGTFEFTTPVDKHKPILLAGEHSRALVMPMRKPGDVAIRKRQGGGQRRQKAAGA
jgi:hypothetical protein